MQNRKIELRQVRDFDAIISDTFQFIKQEFKPLLSSYFAVAGVFILLSGIASGYNQNNNFSQVIGGLFGSKVQHANILHEIFNPFYLLSLFLSVISYVVSRTTLAVYVKLYDALGGISPTINQVWSGLLKNLLPICVYTVFLAIIIFAGFIFFVIPGFYLFVLLVPFNYVVVVEELGFGAAWSRCSKLIRDNFWSSFGLYIVAYIIYSICASAVGLFTGGISATLSYFTTKNYAVTVGLFAGALHIFAQLFYIIFSIAVALNYFSLTEQLDGGGLLKKLDTLGTNNNPLTAEEQY